MDRSLSGSRRFDHALSRVLRENLERHLAGHVGQPEIAAAVAVRQPLVVEAQQVQHGRVQIVDVHAVLDGVVAVVVGGAVVMPPFTPPPAIHIVKPYGLWSRPSPPCAIGVRPNSPPQMTSVSFSSPRAFRSVSSPAIGLIHLSAVLRVQPDQLAVLVPPCCWAVLCEIWMNRTPRSASRRAIRHCRPKSRVSGSSRPYSFLVASDSLGDVEGLGRLGLHAERELERLDARLELRIVIPAVRAAAGSSAAACPARIAAVRR